MNSDGTFERMMAQLEQRVPTDPIDLSHVAPPAEAPALPAKPEDFKFNDAPDLVGLPMEHARYANRNCKTCYGSGKKRLVVVDGSVGTVFDDKSRVVKNPNRVIQACHCVSKGYTKMRKRIEDQVVDIMGGYVGDKREEAEKAVYKRVIAEAFA